MTKRKAAAPPRSLDQIEDPAERRSDAEIQATQDINRRAIVDPGSVPDHAGEILPYATSGETVTIACKLGIAYLDIQLCRQEEVWENTQTGPRQIKVFPKTGSVVRLRGTAYPRGTPPEGFPAPPLIVGGAAMNSGISKEWWDVWAKQNRLNPLVMNGFIFAHQNESHVRGKALEEAAIKSGLEPINPKGDDRMPKSTNAAVSQIETEESRAKKVSMAVSAAAASAGEV
jgi:hypothetical protein